jgi:hypothetical protein
MTNIEIYVKRITAFKIVNLAHILAIAPGLIFFIGFPLSDCNHVATCSWASIPYLMFGTVPLGFVLMIYGIVRFFVSLRFKLTKTNEKTPRERKLKRYLFAWVATAAAPIMIVLLLCSVFVFVGLPISSSVGDILLIIISAIFVLPWVYLLVVAVWNRPTR